ncbi:hypothetical protein SAMN02745150_00042 [Brevinema andersonii]|uniref:Uncharacterized protein n=2 Tax=Brevinema andersonii TaxID=34097 RepID=A0A1I1D3V1_BREAD|nr:hypothetical protein SAMN02745150_00042 [Brevinema andersonii]
MNQKYNIKDNGENMKKFLIVLIFLNACTVANKKEFLENIKGKYTLDSDKTKTVKVSANGRIIHNNIIYTFQEALSSTNAVYLLDDVQYAGLTYNTNTKKLMEIWATNFDKNSIDWENTSRTRKNIGTKQ